MSSSEYRFTDGNLIVVYAIHKRRSATDAALPDYIKELIRGGIKDEIIAIDTDSQNMAETINRISDMVKTKPNPPFIYFIGSVWLHDTFKSNVVSKLKGYRLQFYGALDHRSVDEVEKEKALDVPKKSIENYKQHAKNKAVDVLLNMMFP